MPCEKPLWQLDWRKKSWAGVECQTSAFQVNGIHCCHFIFLLKKLNGSCPRLYRAKYTGHWPLTLPPHHTSPVLPSTKTMMKKTNIIDPMRCIISEKKMFCLPWTLFKALPRDFSSNKNFNKIGRSGKMKPDHCHKATISQGRKISPSFRWRAALIG